MCLRWFAILPMMVKHMEASSHVCYLVLRPPESWSSPSCRVLTRPLLPPPFENRPTPRPVGCFVFVGLSRWLRTQHHCGLALGSKKSVDPRFLNQFLRMYMFYTFCLAHRWNLGEPACIHNLALVMLLSLPRQTFNQQLKSSSYANPKQFCSRRWIIRHFDLNEKCSTKN